MQVVTKFRKLNNDILVNDKSKMFKSKIFK